MTDHSQDELTKLDAELAELMGSEHKDRSRTNLVMGLVAFFLVATLATVFGYAAWAGMFSARAPQTAEERQLSALEALTKSKPTDAAAWADYARGLIGVQQYDTAKSVIAKGSVLTSGAPIVMVQEVRLLNATGDPKGAIAAGDAVVAKLQKFRAVTLADLKSKGITGFVTLPETEAMLEVTVLEGEIHFKAKEWAPAIASLTLALAEDPTASDVLTIRGETYRAMGKPDLARADYRTALKYLPDYAPAKAGLDALAKGSGK